MSAIDVRNVDEEGSPDEIVLEGVKMVHFEYMNDGWLFCLAVLDDGRSVRINIFTKRKAKILTRYEVER